MQTEPNYLLLLVGTSCEAMAYQAALDLARIRPLTPDQIRDLEEMLTQKPPEIDWRRIWRTENSSSVASMDLFLTEQGLRDLGLKEGDGPSAAAQKLLDAGFAIAVPTLYLPQAKEQPMNVPKANDPQRNAWQWAASYTYGYNPSLVAHRVHDAMTAVATIVAQTESNPAKIILIGSDGAGVIAAATAAVLQDRLAGVVVDTEGFRFASLNDQWDPLFVPGAVKYGDLPGLLKASGALKPVVLGEAGGKGGAEAIVAAVLKMSL